MWLLLHLETLVASSQRRPPGARSIGLHDLEHCKLSIVDDTCKKAPTTMDVANL